MLPQVTDIKCRQGTFVIGLNITIIFWAAQPSKARGEIAEDLSRIFLESIRIARTVFLDSCWFLNRICFALCLYWRGTSGIWQRSRRAVLKRKRKKIERLRDTFTPNSKREFVPRDQDFSFIVVYCLLLLLKNKQFHASFIHKNCSEQFLSAYFLFWEILILNLKFAVCRKRDS